MHTLVLSAIVLLSSGWTPLAPQVVPELTLEHCESLAKTTIQQYQKLYAEVAPGFYKSRPEGYMASNVKVAWNCVPMGEGK